MDLALWTVDELPAPTADHIAPTRRDEAARFARAIAAGIPALCSPVCLNSRGPRCDCPCRAVCHGKGRCERHR